VAAIAVVLVGFALGFSKTATQGSVGLAILNLMEFNQSLSMLINSWTGWKPPWVRSLGSRLF
jgi:ATP-binding cassette, subfamily C (CFTR/MRP), member 1